MSGGGVPDAGSDPPPGEVPEPAKTQVPDVLAEALLRETAAFCVGARVVDLSAGSGRLVRPLAARAQTLHAVTPEGPALERLLDLAAGTSALHIVAADLRAVDLPAGSADVIVSCYALHGLHDADKRGLVRRCHRWLRPGGHLLVADMMFGRGARGAWDMVAITSGWETDRGGSASPLRRLLATGRAALRVGPEQPAPAAFWLRAFRDAGFREVGHQEVLPGAGIVAGVKSGAVVPSR